MRRLGDVEKGQEYAIKGQGYRSGDEKKGKERRIKRGGEESKGLGRSTVVQGSGEKHCSAGEWGGSL